jgi:hypothetical protein
VSATVVGGAGDVNLDLHVELRALPLDRLDSHLTLGVSDGGGGRQFELQRASL